MVKESNISTQERILDAATEAFAEKGFAAATTNEIAIKAEVAEGTIFRYFPSKKDLLRATVRKFIEGFSQHIIIDSLERVVEANKAESIDKIIKALIYNRLQLLDKYLPHVKVIINEMQYHQDIRQIFIENVVTRGLNFGCQLIIMGQEKGQIRKDIDPHIAFRSLAGMVLTMIMYQQLNHKINKKDLTQQIDMLVDLFMNGVKGGE